MQDMEVSRQQDGRAMCLLAGRRGQLLHARACVSQQVVWRQDGQFKKNEMHCMEIQTLNCCVCPSRHAENVEGN